ncbi:MAG TPA: RNA polymerase sigma factor, partial [Polyangiaceae bacterium]|nr:RNA polymerase sigma factor [Polyangiaceae bacterium]
GIYRDHFDYVKYVCLKVVKDESIAEDVAQDAFVNVWRKLHTFNGESKITTWLHRVAVNQSLMYLRRQPRIERLQLEDVAVQLLPARSSHPRKRIALNRAIEDLSSGYRTAFLLREVLGYSYVEAAQLLGVTEGTIKSQNQKAKQRLRETLELH